jgi:hypothetical protein
MKPINTTENEGETSCGSELMGRYTYCKSDLWVAMQKRLGTPALGYMQNISHQVTHETVCRLKR